MQSDDHVHDGSELNQHDLEDQIARNEAYGIDLEHAYVALRTQSLYWYVATAACFCFVFGLGYVAFAPSRIEADLLQTYEGQTVVTVMLALALFATVTCFWRFFTLRHLASEALRISRVNQCLIMDARAFLAEIS